MSERHRQLPSWMAKRQLKVKERAPLERQRKAPKGRIVCYCMNEAELVQTATSYLTDGAFEDVTLPIYQQVGTETKDTATKKSINTKLKTKSMTRISEEECLQCNHFDTTDVSETDLDITEVETLPYTKSQHNCESESEKTDTAQDDDRLEKTKTEMKKLEMPAVDADPLQLVREIFFS